MEAGMIRRARAFALVLASALLPAAGGAAAERYELAMTDKPPVIDGKLDDECWKNATTLGDFVPIGGAKIADEDRVATRAMLAADADNLYFAACCEEPLIEKLSRGCTQRDGDVWKDDDVELMIVPCAPGQDRYVQLAVNPA
jgi:hypothetical protein